MDEILAKLRKSTQKSPKKIESPKKTAQTPEEVFIDDSFDSSDISHIEEPTSSQYVTPFTIMKLDFDRLKNIKTGLSITDIINTKDSKINEEIVLIVKKIEKYTTEICHMEMVDDSGSIGCSCMYSLVKDTGIKIGSIIKIKGFSLWKMEINHINLVRKNILKIYKGD